MKTAKEYALDLISRGCYVIPVHTVNNGLCSCGNTECKAKGKHPHTMTGVKECDNTSTRVEGWSVVYKNCNWGVATGHISNLVVVDIDNIDDADRLQNELPETYTVSTGKGIHLYYQYPIGKNIQNHIRLISSVDLRSDNGYVVSPGSKHSSGVLYTVVKDMPFAEFPLAWYEKCVNKMAPSTIDFTNSRYGNVYSEGERNGSLYSIGRSLKAKGANKDAILAFLKEQNSSACNPPLEADEVNKIYESVVSGKNRENFEIKKATGQQKLDSSVIQNSLDFEQLDLPTDCWLLDQIIPANMLTLFAGFQKTGKSTFVFAMMRAIAAGEEFMGLSTKESKILYVGVEESKGLVQTRLKRFGGGHKNLFMLTENVGANTENIYEVIEEAIVNKGIEMVIIDTFASFFRFEDENNNSEVIGALQPILDLKVKYNCAFMPIHHTRKNSGGDILRAIRGAGAITACVDHIVSLSSLSRSHITDTEDDDGNFISDSIKEQKNTHRKIQMHGRTNSLFLNRTIKIELDMCSNNYNILGDTQAILRDARMEALWNVSNGKERSSDELQEMAHLNCPKRTIQNYIKDLVAAGCLLRNGNLKTSKYLRGPNKFNRKGSL